MSRMLDEIAEQPAALEKTLAEETAAARELAAQFKRKRPRFVVLVARGTSDNAALFGRYLIEITTGLPVSLAAPSVTTLYHSRLDWADALVVGLSQSGESTDTNLCLEAAREGGAFTVGVTNEADSSLTKIVDQVMLVRAGREKSVAATKTYTGQLLTMYLLAEALGGAIPRAGLEALPEAAAKAVALRPAVAAMVERYRFMDQAVVLARGLNYATAFEFALKLMETCYVVAERFSGADFEHGPIALLERDFPVFLFAADGPSWDGSLDMARKLRQREADTLVFAPKTRHDVLELGSRRIELPDAPSGSPADLFAPIPSIIPGQLFAALLAEVKGLDPDQPRGLSKVTKTI